MTQEYKMPENEVMARWACADHGYQFCALVKDASGDEPVPGFTYTVPGQDATAPSWVSMKKALYSKWDGSSGT